MKSRTQTEFGKRWTGVVEIKTGDKVAKLTSLATVGKDKKPKSFPDGEMSIRINLSEFPKASQRVIKSNMESKKFRVRLNEDADGVETVTPVSGQFKAHLIGLGPKTKDGEYKLIEKVYNAGQKDENSHLEFIAIYEILEGPFKGVELPGYYLHYKFEDDGEGLTQFNTVNNAQAKQLHKLIAWAEVHGDILEEDIVWPDDGIILDVIEERALDSDREVNLIFDTGYISTVQAVEEYEEVSVDEDESDAVDEMLDGDEEVEPVKVAAPEPKGKAVKKAPAKKSKPADDEDDL